MSLFLAGFFISQSFADPEYSNGIHYSVQSLGDGELIITGTVDMIIENAQVTMRITDSDGKMIFVAQTLPDENSNFAFNVTKQGPLWQNVIDYSVILNYQKPDTNSIFDGRDGSSQGVFLDVIEIPKALLSPLQQFKSGIPIGKIQCKEGLEMLIKSSDGSPVCIKSGNKAKLVERGWAFKSYQSYLVQPKIITSAKNQTGLITWKNQTYYFEMPYYAQDAYTNRIQVSIRDVVFTLFPQPFEGGLPTSGCGGSYYWADAEFSDGTSELLKIFVNSRPCHDDSIPIAVSNHANPQAGMIFINGSFRLLVSDDFNESGKDVYDSDSLPKREITIISISPQNVTLPDKKNQTYKTTCNEQGVCFTPE